MKEKIILIAGYIIILIGLIKFDVFIYPTLDYFGKYVFVLALNIAPFWISWEIYKKNRWFSLVFAILLGFVFYEMG